MTSFFPQKMVPECKPEWKREAITVFSRLPSLRRLQATPLLQTSLGKATYPNYVEELNKLYDEDQKLGGLIVKLGAGTYVALVFRAENVEEFINTHGVKYVNLQKSYLISDNEIQEF